MRVLKNTAAVKVEKNVMGKIYTIKPKGSLTLDDFRADAVAQDLLTTYGFLKDITPKVTYPAPQEKELKVVKRAKSKPGRKGVKK